MGWENSRHSSLVCITVSNSPSPSRVYIRICKHRKKVFYCFYRITLPTKNTQKRFVKFLLRSDNFFRRTGGLLASRFEVLGQARDHVSQKIVLKFKSIVMRTTNNLFRRVHNCTHFKWWFTQFERKCNILEIFDYFQYFERFRSMKKWQISKPKIVDRYLDFSKECYTTLKSVISSFKICFQNYGQLKRKFLRPKNTSSTFLKFELSRLSGPMLKTQKNAIRNQFEQQWFNVISYQKQTRVYRAIW